MDRRPNEGVDLGQILHYLQFCYANNMLRPEQVEVLNQLLLQQNIPAPCYEAPRELFAPPAYEPPPAQFPTNCSHVQICYFIWHRQNNGIDPTELGRKYKEMYLMVG